MPYTMLQNIIANIRLTYSLWACEDKNLKNVEHPTLLGAGIGECVHTRLTSLENRGCGMTSSQVRSGDYSFAERPINSVP